VQWLNEPAQWSEQAGSLVVTAGAGTMCASPEGNGFQVTFHDVEITRGA
jgi:regulation of enolase protein 1 (concanavalin A-like superfamily)